MAKHVKSCWEESVYLAAQEAKTMEMHLVLVGGYVIMGYSPKTGIHPSAQLSIDVIHHCRLIIPILQDVLPWFSI